MDKKLTRKQFLIMAGSLIGILVLSRIPGTGKKIASGVPVANGYGAGTYGGKRTA